MNRQDIHKLLGGYATGTLTPQEQETLFAAALQDQDLFDALAREQTLRDLLSDPAARAHLLAAVDDLPAPWYRAWWRPVAWAACSLLLVAAVLVWHGWLAPRPARMARVVLPAQRRDEGPQPAPLLPPPPHIARAVPPLLPPFPLPGSATLPAGVVPPPPPPPPPAVVGALGNPSAIGGMRAPATRALIAGDAAKSTTVQVTAESELVAPEAPAAPRSMPPDFDVQWHVLRRLPDGSLVEVGVDGNLPAGAAVVLRTTARADGYLRITQGSGQVVLNRAVGRAEVVETALPVFAQPALVSLRISFSRQPFAPDSTAVRDVYVTLHFQ